MDESQAKVSISIEPIQKASRNKCEFIVVEKGDISPNNQFLLFPLCFQTRIRIVIFQFLRCNTCCQRYSCNNSVGNAFELISSPFLTMSSPRSQIQPVVFHLPNVKLGKTYRYSHSRSDVSGMRYYSFWDVTHVFKDIEVTVSRRGCDITIFEMLHMFSKI